MSVNIYSLHEATTHLQNIILVTGGFGHPKVSPTRHFGKVVWREVKVLRDESTLIIYYDISLIS